MTELELIKAIKRDDISAVERLVRSETVRTGLDVKDEHGWTALHWAAGKGSLAITKALLKAGASPCTESRDLRVPSMVAQAAGHAELAKLLKSAERDSGGELVAEEREFCKAYHWRDIAAFGAGEPALQAAGGVTLQAPSLEGLTPSSVVYLHQNYTVTRSIAGDQQPIFSSSSEEWKSFCHEVLNFRVPEDSELVPVIPAAS